MVTLEPMSAERWAAWQAEAIRGYAGDNVRIGAWPAEGAEDRATADLARILPDGQSTPTHDFRSITSAAGLVVGVLWFAPNPAPNRPAIFIWDFVIDDAFRGLGYGRAALAALDAVTRNLGYDAIELHVFGDNEAARNLYRSAGYVETNVSMVKTLVRGS